MFITKVYEERKSFKVTFSTSDTHTDGFISMEMSPADIVVTLLKHLWDLQY